MTKKALGPSLFLLSSLTLILAAAEGAHAQSRRPTTCPAQSVGAHAVMTQKGYMNLVDAGVSEGLELLQAELDQMKFDEFTLSPQKPADAERICGPAAFKEASLREYWESCWGLPAILTDEKKGWSIKKLARPIPTDFKFQNFRIQAFELGPAQTECEGATCTMRVNLERMVVAFDLAAHNLLDNRKLAGLKKLRLEFKPPEGTSAPIEVVARAENDQAGWLKLSAMSIKLLELPPGSVHLSLDLPKSEQNKLSEAWAKKAFAALRRQDPSSESRLNQAEGADAQFAALESARTESNEPVIEGVLLASSQEVYTGVVYDDPISARIGSLLLKLTQPKLQKGLYESLGIMKMFENLINRVAPGLVLPLIDGQTAQIPGVTTELIFPTHHVRIQDYIDADKIGHRRQEAKQLLRTVKAIDLRARGSERNQQLKDLRRTWKVLRLGLASSIDGALLTVASEMLNDAKGLSAWAKSKAWAAPVQEALEWEVNQWSQASDAFKTRMRAAKYNFRLRAQGVKLLTDGRVAIGMSTCVDSKNFVGTTMNNPERAPKGSDVTVGLNVSVLNYLVARNFAAGDGKFLDVCMNKDPKEMCADQSLLAPINRLRLENAPVFAIDSQTGELYVEFKEMVRNGAVLGSDLLGKLPFVGDKVWSGRVYLDLRADSKGNLQLKINRIDGGLTLNTQSIWGFFMSLIESVTFVLQNAIIKGMGSSLVPETDFSINEHADFHLKRVSTRSNTVYFEGELRSINKLGGR